MVVVVVGGGGGWVVVGGASVVGVVVATAAGAGAVVVVVGAGGAVVVVVGAPEVNRTSDHPVATVRPGAALVAPAGARSPARRAWAGPVNKRRGPSSRAPLKSTANNARLPPKLAVLRAPPFSGT